MKYIPTTKYVHLYQEKGLSDIVADTYLLFVTQIGLAET